MSAPRRNRLWLDRPCSSCRVPDPCVAMHAPIHGHRRATSFFFGCAVRPVLPPPRRLKVYAILRMSPSSISSCFARLVCAWHRRNRCAPYEVCYRDFALPPLLESTRRRCAHWSVSFTLLSHSVPLNIIKAYSRKHPPSFFVFSGKCTNFHPSHSLRQSEAPRAWPSVVRLYK